MEPVSAVSILPIEVWGKVFENLEVKDAVNCRLVCSAWTTELDENFDKWVVRLDETSPDKVQHLLQLKVQEARIQDLSTPVDSGQDGPPVLFKYPELLRNLSIPENGRICPENLLLLLQSCEGNIKHLDLDMSSCDDDFLAHASYNIQPRLDFENLETLKIYGAFNSMLPSPIQEPNVFSMMLGQSAMRKIKKLDLHISGLFLNAVSSTLLAFLAKNGRNLEVIKCCSVPNTQDEEPPRPPTSIDLPALREVRGLKNIKISLQGFIDGGLHLDPELLTAWSALLKVQRNLTHLDLANPPISRRILRRLCLNNENTLTKLRLVHLMFDFDLEILSHCIHLKELSLSAYDDGQVLSNVGSLPLGVQEFSSTNYLIDSKDILKFFEGHRELVDIDLHFSGSRGSNGVAPSVLARFVRDRDLSGKLRKIYVWGFNHSSAGDVAGFNEIFRGLQGWKYIQDFRHIELTMVREKGEDGQWSGWKLYIRGGRS